MALKTIEQFRTEATAEIEGEKPLYKQVNQDRLELSDSDYAQAIEDRAQYKLDQQDNGYKNARISAYPLIGDQLDMLFHAIDKSKLDKTSDFYKALKKVKDDNPKPS